MWKLARVCSGLFGAVASCLAQTPQTFSYKGALDFYTALDAGWYSFDVRGAQGAAASNNSHAGGLGARIQGYMYLEKGDTLQIAVGGKGAQGVNAGDFVAGGGGGGGSSIVKFPTFQALVFAGGGGGGAVDEDGWPGLVATAGPPRGGANDQGGTNKEGGFATAAAKYGGAGGGGFSTNGTAVKDINDDVWTPGGMAYKSGNLGGITDLTNRYGGWGGGGAGGPASNQILDKNHGGGGGGGGYSGGGGGSGNGGAGGGGGSYVDPEVRVCLSESGSNASDGSVSITKLANPPVGPAILLSNQTFPGTGGQQTLGPVLNDPTGTTIQWLKDGVLQQGQSAASITLNPFQYTDSGAYQAVLTKAGCTAITRPVYLDTPSLSKLFGWGSNQDLQLGGGSQPTSPRTEVPVPLTSPGATTIENGVVAAAAGQAYSMFVKRDGTLWALGANRKGELGDGTTTPRTVPVQVATDVVAVAAGGGTSKLKSLYSYPKQNDESQGHTLFVKRDGTLWAMGSNNSGQLGIGTRDNDAHPVPVKVANHVVAVSAGSQFSLFLREDGTLWGMGVHSNNQLGLGYGGNTTVAGIVYSTAYPQTYKPSLIASGVVAAAAGDKNSLFVKSDHTLWYAGGDRIFPRKVADQVVAAATGGLSLYVKNDGTLWKVLDTNNWSVSQLADPVAPGCGSKVTAVAASDFALYTYKPGPCLTPDPNQPYSSNLKGFGLNHDGQLNPSFSEYVTTPTTIGGLLVATLGKLHFSNYYFDSDLGQSGEYIYPPQHSLVVATSVSSSNGGLQSVGPKPPPVIVIAGGDFQQSLQRIIIIDASGSTSSTGGPLTYQWSSDDPVWISGNTTAAPTVGLGYSRRLNTLQLTVTDSTGNSSTQQIQIEYLGPLQ